jgi:hypothetical protein
MYQLMLGDDSDPKRGWQPLHVVNITLDTVSTKRLAWQERKAEPFTVTALHSGSPYKGYRSSFDYGHRNRGISLGTAMAISGAAVSPNMGYQSSPTASFVLALFNVRLGWWLGNPGSEGEHTYQLEGPWFAVLPLAYEVFGQTTDDRAYIYLSDGGHFENLGLYEMVRRRCRFIVVADTGCDPEFAFEDLGNAVRKIAIDQGVTVDFLGLTALKPRPTEKAGKCCKEKESDEGQRVYAIGRIHYPGADGQTEEGIIIYIKPGYHDRLIGNAGIRNYARANPAFPHESTGDQ